MNKNDQASIVHLVGAGPGDPDLITIRGLTRLREADVVIYDSLVNKALLKYAKPGARLIHAGKQPGAHHIQQTTINAMLVQHARAGESVVRLKGGDPFVFGRGGEEVDALRAAGISYEVVPGVSSAIAVPASAGIPITHRDCAANFTVLTGHRKCGMDGIEQDWDALSRMDTLIILMGLQNLPRIADKLIASGRPPDTPVAVIQSGTTPQQRVVTGTLINIADRARQLSPPAIIVIGDVVARRTQDKIPILTGHASDASGS